MRANLRRITPFFAAVTIAIETVRIMVASGGVHVGAFVDVLIAFWLYVAVAVVVSLWISLRRASGNNRQRLLWVTATFAVGFSGLVVYFIGLAAGNVSPYVDLSTLTIVCIPFGLGYVMLRHRLLDITFVINRAVVFAVLSSLVVGVFVILETLLAKYVEASNHITSTVVQLVVALCLGFGARGIHARVDRLVDDVFFRERHQAEAALRAFAHDAPLVTDQHTLLERVVELVIRYGHARSAQIWLRRDDDWFVPAPSANDLEARVDENDPAVLAMRSRHISGDLLETRSGLPGTYAFPMLVRGRLIGALVCASNASEAYPPDERDALETVARSVGQAVDGIRVRQLKREVVTALASSAGLEAARPALQRLALDDRLASI